MGKPPTELQRQARREAEAVIRAHARSDDPITYGELAEKISAIRYIPRSRSLHDMLMEISDDSDERGHGLLSVFVVRKDTERPGVGFFDQARGLGRRIAKTKNAEKTFFDRERKRVHQAEKRRRKPRMRGLS